MKYAFIVNPASGQGKHKYGLEPQIHELIATNPDKDIKIYYTKGEKDATPLASKIAEEAGDEVVIFACGGDGTVQEVANGVYGHDNAILGVIPVGSGNDFVRTLGGGLESGTKFLNLYAQLSAPIKKIDLIKLSWTENGLERTCMIDNGINIGFDGYACISAHEYKHIPGVSGSASYLLAVAKTLIKKTGENVQIIADGKEFHNGQMLLATASNGRYCGGGFESCPRADLSDGLIELFLFQYRSRTKFIQTYPYYKSGRIFDVSDEGGKLYKYTQAKKIEIIPNNGRMKFVGDGEIFDTGKITVEVVRDAIKVLYFE